MIEPLPYEAVIRTIRAEWAEETGEPISEATADVIFGVSGHLLPVRGDVPSGCS